MFMRNLATLAAMASVSMSVSISRPDYAYVDFLPLIRRPSRASRVPGKHKLRRHGQKLRSCRNKISRRVRRKHRRAA